MPFVFQPDHVYYRYFNTLRTNGTTTSSFSGVNSEATFKAKEGIKQKGWRRIIALGQNATTHFSGSELVRVAVPVVASFKYGPYVDYDPGNVRSWEANETDGGIFNPQTPPGSLTVDPFEADSAAREEFLKRYRQARTTFHGGVFLGELAETIRMIKNPAKALREGLNRYHKDVKKRLRGKGRKSRKRIVRDSWLEYAFGWRPLVNDAADALKLANAGIRRSMPIRGQGVSTSRALVSQQYSSNGTVFPKLLYYGEYQREYLTRYKGAVVCTVPPASFPEQLGLSWSNVLPTAWELIPYSFLVDYFLNVGKVIEGMSTGVIKLAWGCRTVRDNIEVNFHSAVDKEAHDAAVLGRPHFSTCKGSGKLGHYRTVARFPISEVYFGLTDLRPSVPGATSLKWLNIAALAQLRT